MSAAAQRVALIGYGLAGRFFHAPLLRSTPGLELTAVVTRDPRRRAEATHDDPGVTLLDSPAEVWARRDRIDLVVVASPSGSHAELVAAAIDAALPSVVEKPLATTAAQARSLVDMAAGAGLLLVPFHNRRWDSDQLTLRRLLERSALGAVHRFESRFERWRPNPNGDAWRETTAAAAGGGILLDLGVHLVDQAVHLFGAVDSVHGEVASRRGGADDDVFIALHHRGGVESHLWASALSAAPGPRLRVLGSEAAFVVQPLDGQEDALRAGRLPHDDGFGVEPREHWGRLWRGDTVDAVPSEPGRWLTFYEGVERSLRTGAPPPVAAGDAVLALDILDAARRDAGG